MGSQYEERESKASAGGDPLGVFVEAARVVGWKLGCSCACVDFETRKAKVRRAFRVVHTLMVCAALEFNFLVVFPSAGSIQLCRSPGTRVALAW